MSTLTHEQHELEELFDSLTFARERAAGADDGGQDFVVSICGGNWTMKHLGRSHDAYKGQCKSATGQACQFARSYGLQLSQGFNVDLYTEEGALELAKTWVSKAQHYFDLWQAQSDSTYRFSEEDHKSWLPGPRFVELLETWSERACARARALRDFRPLYRK